MNYFTEQCCHAFQVRVHYDPAWMLFYSLLYVQSLAISFSHKLNESCNIKYYNIFYSPQIITMYTLNSESRPELARIEM